MNDKICACIGPKQGEPHCMCLMIALGLKQTTDYEMSVEQKEKMSVVLNELFPKK